MGSMTKIHFRSAGKHQHRNKGNSTFKLISGVPKHIE